MSELAHVSDTPRNSRSENARRSRSPSSEPNQFCLRSLIEAALAQLARRAFSAAEVTALELNDAEVTGNWYERCEAYLGGIPHAEDLPLFSLAHKLRLTPLEVLSVALAQAVERDTRIAHAVTLLQAPSHEPGPSLGLLQLLFGGDDGASALSVDGLVHGAALESGLLELQSAHAAWVERRIRIPTHLSLALVGIRMARDGYTWEPDAARVPLPAATIQEAKRHASALTQTAASSRGLVLRAAEARDARTVAFVIAQELGLQPVFITADTLTGLAPWLHLQQWLPVFDRRLAPGEHYRIPVLARYTGPALMITGLDGSIELANGAALMSWTIPLPNPAERAALWHSALADSELADALAPLQRCGASRIAELAELALQRAHMDRCKVQLRHVVDSTLGSRVAGLATLAEPISARISPEALILPDETRRELDLLVLRCRIREQLTDMLGACALARQQLGVRALLTGNSGTGKTLAASWLATQLSAPLYRVDIASIVSKYIGETERNLSQLLASAEHAGIILLFDEADSLFGKRTEVRQANDRFANTQTNYLLQRIETYEGIVVLTSNSRSRIDAAFTRRLDFVIEFGDPGPEERRQLWLGHLGRAHALTAEQINQLSMTVDLCGGNIRSVVLCAAVLARDAHSPMRWEHVLVGLELEYRKLGRQLPAGLMKGKR